MDLDESPRDHVRNQRRLSGRFTPPVFTESETTEDNEDEPEGCDQEMEQAAPLRRSSRTKIRPLSFDQLRIPGPKKLSANSSMKDIEKYYLDKRVKKQNLSLETIYEVPQNSETEEVVMSSRKYRRLINFNANVGKNSAKVKKRKMKAKKVTSGGHGSRKVSLKFLMEKLAEIQDE